MTSVLANAFSSVFPGRREGEPVDITPPTENRVVGKVIKVSPKGFGFISSKDIAFTRIFFHWTSLRQDTLNFKDVHVGQMVEFTPRVVEGKGTRAIKIKVLPEVVELTTEEIADAEATTETTE